MRFPLLASVLAIAVTSPALALNADAKRAENYQQADANGDRKLSKAEFKVFINANAADGLGNASKIKRFGAYNRAFKKLDANSDGFVTVPEMAAAKKK